MSKILFFVATLLLVGSIGANTPSSTTTGPSTSTTTDASHQKPAVIADIQNPSHDTHTVRRREDSHAKPAVITAGAESPDHKTNVSTSIHSVQKREESESQKPAVIITAVSGIEANKSYDSHFVHKREESQQSQKPAVISAGVSDHQNNTSNDTHSVQRRESPTKPPVAFDVTFSTIKPTGGVSASTQRPSDSQENTGNACIQNYEPVCGSDGKTYSNLCMLGLATQKNPAIVLAKKGEC